MTLPPLPSPNVEVISGHRAPFVSYDADHMKAYGKQCRETAALRKAAQAVVDRWDTPLWKDVPATAEYINALRRALV